MQWRSQRGSVRSQYVLSDAQVREMLLHTMNLRDRLLLELMVYCGLRLQEVATLEIARITFDTPYTDGPLGSFTVMGKGQKWRRVPMLPVVAAHLKSHIGKRRHGYVFEGRDGPHLTDRAIQDVVKAAGVRMGFKQQCPGLAHLNPHMLRHTCARRLKAAGASWETIARVLGHNNILRCIELYGTLTNEEVVQEFLTKQIVM